MQQRLKERLVGASVLMVVAVIFIPMILDGPIDSDSIEKTNIPQRPNQLEQSKLVPITDNIKTRVSIEAQQVKADTATATVAVASDDAVSVNPENSEVNELKTSEPAQELDEKKAETSREKNVGLSAWVVQLGSFSTKLNADKLNLQLRKAGFPAFVEPQKKDDALVYRVRVGPELLRADADKLLKAIKSKMDLDGIVLRYP